MKKVLSFLLTCAMVCSLFPAPALAEAVEEVEEAVTVQEVEPQEDQPEENQTGLEPQETPSGSEETTPVEETEPASNPAEDGDLQVATQAEGESTKGIEIGIQRGNTFDTNHTLYPTERYTLRASDDDSGDYYYGWWDSWWASEDYDTIRFTPTSGNPRSGHTGPFDVLVDKDNKLQLTGLFYREGANGPLLPLPNGTYTITYDLGDDTSGTPETFTTTDVYTVSNSRVFNPFYEVNAGDDPALQRGALSIKAATDSESELDVVSLYTAEQFNVNMALSLATVADITANSEVSNLSLTMRLAQTKAGNRPSLQELATSYAADDLDAWPSAFTGASWYEADRAKPVQRVVWRANANDNTGTNDTTWAISNAISQSATLTIGGLNLGKQLEGERKLAPGVYFPVLEATIDGEDYRFAYNPVEVAYVSADRQAPTIVADVAPDAMRGISYSMVLGARTGSTGEAGTFAWSLDGQLPAGRLTFDAQAGTITGFVAADAEKGNYQVTATLTETIDGVPMATTQAYTIRVVDRVSLGTIEYSKDTIWIEDSDGETLNLSVPITMDVTDPTLNLSKSEVHYSVYQTSRGGGNSLGWGETVSASRVISNDGTKLVIPAHIDYTTATIDRIEVNLRLKDNEGNEVMGLKEGDTTGSDYEWAIVTSAVEDPGIRMGSYVYAPALAFESNKTNLPTEGRVRLWRYTEGSTAVPADPEECTIGTTVNTYNDSFKLEPGTYVLTAEGKVGTYDADGNTTGTTRWVDILGGIEGGEAIADTKPVQYKFNVGPNEGTRALPGQLGITYTDKNVQSVFRHSVEAMFQQEEDPEQYTAEDVAYDVVWYRRKGDSEEDDVAVAVGYSMEFGASLYDLYVKVVPRGRDSSFWKESDKVLVTENTETVTVQVPRKGFFNGNFTIVCPENRTPKDGEAWGIVEVQTPIASGGYVSANYWPTKEADDNNVVRIPNLTSGSIITFTPRIELKGGQVRYEVPATTSADFNATLTVPDVDGLVTFEGLTFTDEDGTKQNMRLDDGLTGVSVARVLSASDKRSVPFYIADGSSLILLPEYDGNTQNIYQNYYHTMSAGNAATYEITVTRRSANTQDKWGTTAPDYVARTVEPILVTFNGDSGNPASQTQTVPATSLTSYGYASVKLENSTKRLYTLLLYDHEGNLVESGPAGKLKQLRTPHLEAGDYTLYAVDSDAMPRNSVSYNTIGALTTTTLTGDKENRGTNTSFTIANGTATAGTLLLPTWAPDALVDQNKSFVTVGTAYQGTISIQMHAELAKGVNVGSNAYLEISTNQETKETGGYLAPKALTLNGLSVALDRWDTLLCTGPDLVRDFTGNMEHGDLAINLDRAKQHNDKCVRFPLDMTLVIPRTVSGYTEANVWLVQNRGTKNEKRTLVGSYQSDLQEASLTAPEVAAWKTFYVYGEAGPNANVTVFLNGMRAATTVADDYGYYEAEVTLPGNVEEFDEFKLYAAAQWTRGTGANAVGYAAITNTSTVLYSTTFPAIERITLCYQSEPKERYHYMVAYDKGRQPSKYLTAYAAERVDQEEEGSEHAKDFWLIEFANGGDIDTLSVDAVRGDDVTSLTTTDRLATASNWVTDIAEAKAGESESGKSLAQYGWYYGQSVGSMAYDALKANGTDEAQGHRSFITSPKYFEYSPEDLDIGFTLTSLADKDEPVQPVLGALDTGSYTGWRGENGNSVTQADLATYLSKMAEGGRMWLCSQSDATSIEGSQDITTDKLNAIDSTAMAQSLLAQDSGTVDEWLILGNGNSAGETSQELIKVHHTVSKSAVAAADIRSAMEGRLATAKQATDAYEDFWYNGNEPASPVYYDGKWVVEAGGVKSTGTEGMPYFIETMDDAGNVTAEWLQKFYIDNGDGAVPNDDSNYVWCLTTMEKSSYRLTRWDEKNAESVTMEYRLPDNLVEEGRCSYYDILEQWGVILHFACRGLMDGLGVGKNVLPQTADASEDDSVFDPLSVLSPLTAQSIETQENPKKKTWWDKVKDFVRGAESDPEDNSVHAAVQQGQEAGDVTQYADPNSKAWKDNKEQLESGTVGGANALGTKAKKSKEIAEKGGIELVKALTSHTPGPVGQIAGGIYWYDGHDKWLKQQWNDYGTFSWNKEKDYQVFRDGLYKLKNGERPDRISAYFWSLYSKYSQDTIDEWSRRFWSEMEELANSKKESIRKKKDPSGIVYEAVLSNPVEGATVKLYTYNATAAENALDPAQFMDSHIFGVEDNPQTTGVDGRYQWFVPEGYWQVRVSKEGYEDFSTGDWGREERVPVYDDDGNIVATMTTMVGTYGLGSTMLNGSTSYWMPVLPIQLDVNIPLVSKAAPTITSMTADETGATVTFSKYMKADTVTADLFTLAGKAPAKLEATDAEAAGDGSGVMLARTFRLTYADGLEVAGKQVDVVFSDTGAKVQSYAGVQVAEQDRTHKVTVKIKEKDKGNVKHIAIPKATNRTYNGKEQTGVAKGDGYTLSGTASATNAGNYTATAKLASGCMWSDGTTADKKLSWSIAKAAGSVEASAKTVEVLLRKAKKKAQKVNLITATAGATFSKVSGAKQLSVDAKTGKVTLKKGVKKAKTFKAVVRVTSPGDANHNPASTDVNITVKVVKKLTNPMKVTTSAKRVKASKAKGKVTYKKTKGSKNISVSAKNGKIKVKKGTKKGTYTIKVKVTAAGNKDYKKATKTVSCKVTVK